ncbi:hypothetical protein EDB87DRAFT_1570007, partial [Lactarius vividus]
VSISPTPPPPHSFNLNTSDVRVNGFWFMSLVFSISAALLATLVQQWVRDYMHVFQRYSSPLKGARLRQYHIYTKARRDGMCQWWRNLFQASSTSPSSYSS